MTLKFKQSAIAIIAAAFAAVIAPPAHVAPSEWAAKNFVLPDGEHKGELIDLKRTPHLIEVIDALGPDSTINEIAVMKSAQSAFTTALQIIAAHSIDTDPCDMMVVQPTESALSDFNSQKLGRAIDLSRDIAAQKKLRTWGVKVRPQTAKSGTASTTYEKKFPGGALFLSLATSTADLRSKTIKKAFLDEIDEYPRDLNDQGDPLDMVEARQISFLRSGTWKRAYFSTPTIKGASKIEEKHEIGDQRRWTMTCPHCGDTNLRFEWGKNFVFEKVHPFKAHYVAPCCGGIIEGNDKYTVYLTGRWAPTAEGYYPSYRFSAFESPFVPFEEIARKCVEAGDDPSKLKTFENLVLGIPHEIRGDAPDHVRLMSLREDYQRGRIPPRGLLLTASADVQANAIYVEIVAWASDRQSWVVDAFPLDGDTSDINSGAFAKLAKVFETQWPDSFGGQRRIDLFGVDSGFRAHVVYAFARQRVNCLALKGGDGWARPAISTPSLVDVDFGGKRIKHGASVWTVGTWSLKAQLFADLRKQRLAEGAPLEPSGACHHGKWLEENYFVQLTNEYLADERHRGRQRKVWKERGANHFLDCRIYNMALADYLGLSRMTADEWKKLAKIRAVPEELANPELLAPESVTIAAALDAVEKKIVTPPKSDRPQRRSTQSSFM